MFSSSNDLYSSVNEPVAAANHVHENVCTNLNVLPNVVVSHSSYGCPLKNPGSSGGPLNNPRGRAFECVT